MADKSQRNQFKKKVTTCPLLLSLFLLGTIKATTEDAATNYETKMNDKMLSSAGTAGYWKAGATAELKTAANVAWDRAGCYTACKALAGAGKHTACTHTQVFTLTPGSGSPAVATVALVNKCEHFESVSATSAVFFDPLIHQADAITGDLTTKTVSWVWNIQSDAPSNDAAEVQEAVKKYIGVPKIEGTYSTSASPPGLQGAQNPTGLYLYFGNKADAGNLVDQPSTTNNYRAAVPASGIWQAVADTAVIKTRVGAPPVGAKITAIASGATPATKDPEVPASGLYALLGNEAIPASSSPAPAALGATDAVAASGLKLLVGTPAAGQTTLFAAIGAPQQPKLYHTVSGSVVVNESSGAAATGLYARIGGPAVASVIANSAGTLAAGDKASIPVSGLWEKIGSPAVAGTPVGGTDGTNPTTATTNTASTGLYKHIGDPAAAAIAYAAASGVIPKVVGKIAIPASGMYKSIADKAVTSCPTEAQIKEVIKTTEPKAPADGAEARFAATLLASAAALAALV